MDFSAFRELKGWTLTRAAQELRTTGLPGVQRINDSVVSKHERGLRFPPPEAIEAYARITDGAVTWTDWMRLRQSRRPLPPRRRGRRPEMAAM